MTDETRQIISASTATEMLFGIEQLCRGMGNGPFYYTLEGVLSGNESKEDLTADQLARDFMLSYYDICAGAFRVIAAGLEVINSCLVNDDLKLENVQPVISVPGNPRAESKGA